MLGKPPRAWRKHFQVDDEDTPGGASLQGGAHVAVLTRDPGFLPYPCTYPTISSSLLSGSPTSCVGPPQRATRGFVGYDLQRHKSVFIKDTWQVDLPDITKEGDTYQLLAASKVKNIAPCSAAGDIEKQATLMHLYKDHPWACKTKMVLVPHHYWLVLDVIGKPLTTFSSSWEMLCCVLDALEGTCFICTVPAATHF